MIGSGRVEMSVCMYVCVCVTFVAEDVTACLQSHERSLHRYTYTHTHLCKHLGNEIYTYIERGKDVLEER